MEKIKTISIIGLGLIGGSLAMALKKDSVVERIIGIDRNEESLQDVVRLGLIDNATTDLFFGVKDADMVVLATPISAILKITNDLIPYLRMGTIVTDVGSTKETIVRHLTPILSEVGVHFVGAHPMAGSHESGLAAAKEYLFKNVICTVTPLETTNQEALNIVRLLWSNVGCRVIELTPEIHDKLVSATSHLPHLIAGGLINLINEYEDVADDITCLIGSGFKDTTRIAGGEPVMWKDIFLSNKTYLLDAILRFKKILDKWENMIQTDNNLLLTQEIENIGKLKQKYIK